MTSVEQILADVDRTIAAGPFAAKWQSLERYQIPAWYKDAKFGIFVHWGAYSVPAFGNEWYPRCMYLKNPTKHHQGYNGLEHHLATYGPHDRFGYKDFIPQFRAEHFDAGAWADLFKASGARFVMPVAEHHDGFPMYDCGLTRWKATEMGPKRDVLAELSTAIQDRGMVFTCSSHRAEHWWFFSGGREFDSDVNDPELADLYGPAMPMESTPDAAFLDDWLARTCELVTKYAPRVVWFDWWIETPAFEPYLKRFAAFYYNWAVAQGVEVAINYKHRAFPPEAAVFDIERGQVAGVRPLFWQNDTSVSKNSWGYIEGHQYKEATSIIQDLVDVISKNGALLLNVGPKADGTIPEPEQQMLSAIGKWLDRHQAAVYGTRPWKLYGEGPTAIVEGGFSDTKRSAFTAEDVRFTCREETIYGFVLARPADGVVRVKSLSTAKPEAPVEIRSVQTIDGIALPYERDEQGLTVRLDPSTAGETVDLFVINA